MALATTTVSGLVSGLDTATIIQQLMAIERRPITKLQAQIDTANAQKQAFTTINTALLALKTSAHDLARVDTWDAKKVVVSDASVLSAEVTSGTPAGTYSFKVTQLAEAAQLGSNGFEASEAVGAGSFQITVGTGAGAKVETINVSDTDTLANVAAAINAKNMGASAVVVNTGAASDPYKLVVTSTQTGADNAVVIDNYVDTTLRVDDVLTQAKNARIEFGTSGTPLVVESASNTVTGLAPGLTIDLKSTSTGMVSVSVSADGGGILQKAKDFVSKYNAVIDAITANTKFDVDKLVAAPLTGNSILRFLSDDLARAVGDSVAGVQAETNSLTMVGFKLDQYGKLTLDENVFSSALDKYPAGVTQLFSAEAGVAHRLDNLLSSVTDKLDGGIVNEQSALDQNIASLQKAIDDLNVRMTAKEERLRAEFSAMEAALSQLQSQSNFFLSQMNANSTAKK